MPTGFLTDAERTRLSRFPTEVPREDMIAYFTLSDADRLHVPTSTAAHNRLGFALQLGALRYLGFCPDVLTDAPRSLVAYVATQVGARPEDLTDYGQRDQTRTAHARQVQAIAGYQKPTHDDLTALANWLLARALEHDRPIALLLLACDRLRVMQRTRPALTVLERLVASARRRARDETFHRVEPLLTPERRAALDALLVTDASTDRTPLAWLRQGATRCTPTRITAALAKLAYVQRWMPATEDLAMLTPNLRKVLALVGSRATPQALARMDATRRYPVLLAFLHQAHHEAIDEALDLFDRCLGDTYARAGRALDEFRPRNQPESLPFSRPRAHRARSGDRGY